MIHQNERPERASKRLRGRQSGECVYGYCARIEAETPGRSSSTIRSTGNSGAILATGNSKGGLSIPILPGYGMVESRFSQI
jgi:hypothetical protein